MNELDDYFATVTLPKGPLQLSAHTSISDVNAFVQSSLKKARAGNFQSRVSLLQLKDYIEARKSNEQPTAQSSESNPSS